MPGACGLRPCARTHQKKALCHTCPLGGACNKYCSLSRSKSGGCNNTALLQLLGSNSTGLAGCGADLAEYVMAAGDFLRPLGAFPPGFYPLRGGSSPGAWGAPTKGNADGAVGIFGNTGRVWATALRSDPPKKALCLTCPLGGACNKYRSLGSVLASRYQEWLYSWLLSLGGVSPSYRLCMYYLPSIYFLLLISVSCHHLNLPLDHNTNINRIAFTPGTNIYFK